MFLVCPRCLQARPAPLQNVGFRCSFCQHSWEAPDVRYARAYFGELDELEISLSSEQGDRLVLAQLPAELGRDSDFLPLQKNLAVSRRHCRLSFDQAACQFLVHDLNSTGGTYVGNRRVTDAGLAIVPGMVLRIAGLGLRFQVQLRRELDTVPSLPSEQALDLAACKTQALLVLHPAGHVCVDPDGVSEGIPLAVLCHNEADGTWRLLALQRPRVRINGETFVERALQPFDQVTLNGRSFQFDPRAQTLAPDTVSAGPTLELADVSLFVRKGFRGRECLLRDVHCRFPGGRLTAIIGLSGSGKSTLLKILSGTYLPQQGSVRVDGKELPWSQYANSWARQNLALVPQADVIHGELSVRACLEFAAALQQGKGRAAQEQRDRVQKVLGELGLERQQHQAIHSLSGGERKRVNVASELLAAPRLLLLDEPTTGLDFYNEQEVVRRLRQLSRQGRTVVFVTHSLASLEAVDHVVFISKKPDGGRVLFQDTGQQVLGRLEQGSARLYEPPAVVPASAPAAAGGAGPFAAHLPQFLTLTLRYWRRWWASPVPFLAFFFALPLFLGILIRVAVAGEDTRNMDRLLFGLIAAFWFGMNESVREIVREKDIFLREQGRGVGAFSYLASKLLFFTLVGLLQSLLLALPLKWLAVSDFSMHLSLGDHACPWWTLWGILWLAVTLGCVGGLFLSSLCLFLRQQGEVVAVLLVILWTLPQFLFSAKMLPNGRLVEVGNLQQYHSFGLWLEESSRLPELLSYTTVSRYLYLPLEATVTGYRDLDKIFLFNLGILLAVALAIVVLTWLVLEINVIRQKQL